MDIEAIRLDMPLVTSGGICGNVVAISKEGGLWLETEDRTRFPVHVECVKPVYEHVFYADGSSNYDLCDGWAVARAFIAGDKVCLHGKAKTVARCYNGQPDMLPLAEVAKCYKQVEPEQLLLSEDAKVICEMLQANGPMTSHEISDRWCLSERVVLECLLEAREAGIVRLDDGKYSIVRD